MSQMGDIRQLEIDGRVYTFLPIDVAIKYSDKIKSGFFVPLSETKRVRIEVDEGDLKANLTSYKSKGLENILFEQNDYDLFLRAIKRGLTGFFSKDADDQENKPLNIQQILFLVKKSTLYVGIKGPTIEKGEEQIEKFLQWIKGSTKFNPVFKTFVRENQEQFIINIFASYIGIALSESLNWPPHIAEKITQASILGDLCLREKDYFSEIAANGERSRWTENFLTHPLKMAKNLKKYHSSTISREVIRAVEQHQELPDGSGYPQGLKGLSIDQLSAIIIVARTFTDAMVASNFSYDDRNEFVKNLLQEKFDYNNFKNPTKALYAVMGISEEDRLANKEIK